MKTSSSTLRLLLAAAAVLTLSLPHQAHAQFREWINGGTTNWSTAGNWGGGAYTFAQLEWKGNGSATSWNDLSSPQSQWRFYFSGSTAYTLGGNAVSFFDNNTTNGGILSDSSVTQTINMDLNFTDNGARDMFILTRGAGGLTFGGAINLTSNMTSLGIGGTNASSVITFNGPITGNKGIIIGTNALSGGGTDMAATRVVFNGSNSYTGTTHVARGNLSITNNNSIGTNNLILGLSGSGQQATLEVNSSLNRTNIVAIHDGGINSQISVASGQVFTISTNLINSSGATATTKFGKAGAGTLLLAGTASTYAGQIQIGEGTVVIGSSASLGTNITTATRGIDLGLNVNDVNQTNNVSLLLSNGVVLSNSIFVSANTITGTNYTRTIGIAGTGTATISNQIFLDGNLTFDIGAGNNITSANAPAGSVFIGTGGLIKTGAGTLNLSGLSTYTGKTVLAGGVVFMSGVNDTRFGANPTSHTADSLTLSNGVLLSTTNSTSTTSTWNANRGITVGDGGATWLIAGTVQMNLAGTNLLNGSGDLTKAGSGTLTIANSNSFSGAMRSTNSSAGTIILNHQFGLANSTLIRTNGGATLLFSNAAGTAFNLGGLAASASGVGSDIGLTNSANAAITLTVGANNQSTTYAGILSAAGALAKTGTGTLTLSGANTYSGGTLVSAGTLQGSTTSLQGNITNNAVLLFSNTTAGTNSSVISGNGALVKAGGSTVTLGASNSYTGGTTIVTESLTAGTNGAFGTGRLTFSNSGTARLNLNGFTNTITGLTLSGAGAKAIQNEGTNAASAGRLIIDIASGTESSDATTQIRNGSSLAAGFGTLALTKTGAGTLDLSVINSSAIYSGGLTVNAGTLGFGAATNAVGSGAITLGGGTLRYTATGSTNAMLNNTFALTPSTTSAIEVAASTVALSVTNVISGSGGALTKTGAGTLALAGGGVNTYSGLTTVSEGTLQLNKTAGTTAIAGNLSVGSGATLLISASDQVAGTSAVTLSGGTIVRGAGVNEQFGTLDLTAASTINYGSGAAGTLQFGIYEGGLTPNAKLTVSNFGLGNVLIFGNDLGAGGLGLIPATFSGTTFTSTWFDITGMEASAFGGFRSSWNGSTFTITSVPEPSTLAAALGLTALLGWPVIRRRFGKSKI